MVDERKRALSTRIEDGMDEVTARERRLREARLERRALLEEAEAAVVELDAASRTLAEALLEWGERGDRCALEVGVHRLVGRIVHVGVDLVGLEGDEGVRRDLALAGVRQVARLERGATVRRVDVGHPRTLLARSRELVALAAPVEVARLDRAAPVSGLLVAAAPTHLELDAGPAGPVLIAWAGVAWLAPA
jgi:hypothetical protein